MTTIHRDLEDDAAAPVEREAGHLPNRQAVAALRIGLWAHVLRALFDKLQGFGCSTRAVTSAGVKTGIDSFSKDAWLSGGNPTLDSSSSVPPPCSRASTKATSANHGSTG